MKLRPKLCIASSMPQQSIGSTARTLSSTDTDRNPRQTGCPQLVASYDTQEDTLGLFYIPGPTGGLKQLYDGYSGSGSFGKISEECQGQIHRIFYLIKEYNPNSSVENKETSYFDTGCGLFD